MGRALRPPQDDGNLHTCTAAFDRVTPLGEQARPMPGRSKCAVTLGTRANPPGAGNPWLASLATVLKQSLASVVKFSDECLCRDDTKGIVEDVRYLVPIDLVLTGRVEKHAQPPRECPVRRHGWLEISFGVGTDQCFLRAWWGRAPQRNPAIAVVVVVVGADWGVVP